MVHLPVQIQKSLELMGLCLQGTDYFYRYDQFQLKTCITLAYVGWAGILIIFLVQDRLVGGASGRVGRKSKQKVQLVDQILFVLSIIIFVVLTGLFDI